MVAIVVGLAFAKFYRWWTGKADENRTQHAIVAFAFCLILSYAAEEFFGVADITGAFVAGLVLSNATDGKHSKYLTDTFESLSFLYLSPIFFASIGLQVELDTMNAHILLFAIVLTIVAILTKNFWLRPGGVALPLLQAGVPSNRRGDDLPGRGGPDRGHQGRGIGSHQLRALWPCGGGCGGHHHHHPHPLKAGLPGQALLAPEPDVTQPPFLWKTRRKGSRNGALPFFFFRLIFRRPSID